MAEIAIKFPEKLSGLFKPRRYKVLYGGRGAGRSWGVARALLTLASKKPLRILCAREFQNSIKDSVHELLKRQIRLLELSSVFRVLETEIRGVNGSEFIFSGLRNVRSRKSLEGVDIAWVEEAEAVSEYSWDILEPTIRKKGSEIWINFNPEYETDATYRRFVINTPNNCWIVKLGWKDNPWFPEELRELKDRMYATDPDRADWVWGGNCRKHSKAEILYGKWVVQKFNPDDTWDGPYQGIDWGFAEDPTVLVRCWISNAISSDGRRVVGQNLWISNEVYGTGVDNDQLAEFFDSIPDARKYTSRADSSRPETIRHVNNHGYPNVKAANKWQGSVEDGIRHLRGYKKIIIHTDCPWTADEAKNYKYKVDQRSEDVLPIIVDKHNHCIDAIRYALEPIIRKEIIAYSGYKSAEKRPASATTPMWGGFRSRKGSVL